MSNKYSLTISCDCETRFTGEDESSCGICVDVCPEVFEITSNRARIKSAVDVEKYIDKVKIAIEKCPVEAIVLCEAKGEQKCRKN